MRVTLEPGEGEIIAAVHGEVDADNCQEFGIKLLNETGDAPRLVVDLSGLAFIDSSGISELIKVSDSVQQRGQEFALRQPSPTVHRVLEITGLLGHFGLS